MIVDICRDLGIDASHPLWREIKAVLTEYDGNMARMMNVWFSRSAAYLVAAGYNSIGEPPPNFPLGEYWLGPPPIGTGPP